jgi:hypothetical protein
MPEFPIMAVDDDGQIHRIGYDEDDRALSACGLWVGKMAAILAYNPTCPECAQRYGGDA